MTVVGDVSYLGHEFVNKRIVSGARVRRARLRRRAPKLERKGDELQARESRRARRRRRAAERRAAAGRRLALVTERPYVTIAAILGPAILLIVQRAADLSVFQLGAGYLVAWLLSEIIAGDILAGFAGASLGLLLNWYLLLRTRQLASDSLAT